MAKTTSSINYLTTKRPVTSNPVVATVIDPITGLPIPDIEYDEEGRITSVNYQTGFKDTPSEKVTFSYDLSGNLIFKNVTYKNHYINVWEATIVPISPAELEAARHAHTQVELKRASDLGLSLNNVVVGEDDMDLITMNNGELIFTPIIS
jgi:YD repeat-containing protein